MQHDHSKYIGKNRFCHAAELKIKENYAIFSKIVVRVMEIKRLKYIIAPFGFLLLMYIQSFSDNNVRGGKPLYFYCDKTVSSSTDPAFPSRIYKQFREQLKKIGYNLEFLSRETLSDTANNREMILFVTMEQEFGTEFDDNMVSVMRINLVSVEDWGSGQKSKPFRHPLISLSYEPEELSTFETVLIRKTVENLRTQYVCNLRIHSIPEGAAVRSEVGLEGITPLEWILPVGDISIQASLDGYEQIRKTLNINDPGTHTVFLDMKKRQFYNSKFIYPSVGLGLAAIACLVVENHYYSKYSNLGKQDYHNNPEMFEKYFDRAQTCERLAIASSILCGVSFCFTFIF